MDRFDPNLNEILVKRRELYGESDVSTVVSPPNEPALEHVVYKTVAPLIAKRMEFLQDRIVVTGRFLNNVPKDELTELKKSQSSIHKLPKPLHSVKVSSPNEKGILVQDHVLATKTQCSVSSQHFQDLAELTPRKATYSFSQADGAKNVINNSENGSEKKENQTQVLANFNDSLNNESDLNTLNAKETAQLDEKVGHLDVKSQSSVESFKLPLFDDDDKEDNIDDNLERRFTFGGFDYLVLRCFTDESQTEKFFNNDDRLIRTPTKVDNQLLKEAKGKHAKGDNVEIDGLNRDQTSCDYVFRTDSVLSDTEIKSENNSFTGTMLRRRVGSEHRDFAADLSSPNGHLNENADIMNNPSAFRTPGMYWASRQNETRDLRLRHSMTRQSPPPSEADPVPPRRLSRGRRFLNSIRDCCGCCFGQLTNRSESESESESD